MMGQYGVSAPQVPYQWIWADAAARLSQGVAASQVGFRGLQQDINQEYQLLDESPIKWGFIEPKDVGPKRYQVSQNNNAGLSFIGFQVPLNTGTATAIASTITTPVTQLSRMGSTTAAVAGSLSQIRGAGGANVLAGGGVRWKTQFTTEVVSANMRWYAGIAAAVGVANVNPNTFTDAIGIGRNNQANVQLYHNDAAGLCTEIDLGASFPAVTALTGFELYIYTLDGSSYSYNIKNIGSGAEVSGILTLNIPANTIALAPMYYVSNNTDAVAVTQGFANLEVWQLSK